MAIKQTGQGGQQMGLPTLDWQTCQCGCGLQFLPLKKGRQRKYYNDTHKTRVYRHKRKEREYYDAECEEIWRGVSDEGIAMLIRENPDSYYAWSGQWELYRRGR